MVSSLDELPFDNRFTASLNADPDPTNRRRQVAASHYSRVTPTPVAEPHLVIASAEMVSLLGITSETVASADFAAVFGGNRVPSGADPFAMNYGGHQFGNWAGQLGDGRAIALGEIRDTNGALLTLQLKGAGPTPYSRTADGRAVLRSSIREFLCSEAMFHLGVPTTRALSLVATGDRVVRDMLYDGNPQAEPGAIVCRVAPSFVRFGNFQLPASRGELDELKQLVDYTIRADFAHLAAGLDDESTWEQTVALWLGEVCERTIQLVVHWMRVGFVHGVLNTDNMSILGLTIDFGPYGWLEDFDPGWTPNTTDAGGRRYRYGAQPQVVYWNLVQLANALSAVVPTTQLLQEQINKFPERYTELFRSMMRARLGLSAEAQHSDVDDLIQTLLNLLPQAEIDQVLFFRNLADAVGLEPELALRAVADCWYNDADATGPVAEALADWLQRWSDLLVAEGRETNTVRAQMNATNPKFVLRNYLAQEAIDLASSGDYSLIHTLLDVLRRPYDDQPSHERFAQKRPEWARNRVGCSMLSCSS